MGRVLAGRYEIGSLIGSGGTARVYGGWDSTLHRRVAVKLLDGEAAASSDPANRDRFLGEAKSAAGFTHPGAVAVFDAGETDGDLFIVMELVDGRSLAHLIADEAPMPETRAVDIVVQLLDALGAAHAAGLVHRDVKPANVLVGRNGIVKLADFGIAKRFGDLAESLTSDGMVIGTRAYLSPERAAGEPPTPAVDQYAVGVLLYEMLTGARPPLASTGRKVGADVRDVRADVSAGVAYAISRALAPRPELRFSSVIAMAAWLRGRREAIVPVPPEPPCPDADRTMSTAAVNAAGAATALLTRVVRRRDDPASATGSSATAPTEVLAPPPVRAAPAASRTYRRRRPWWVPLVTVVGLLAGAGLAAVALDAVRLGRGGVAAPAPPPGAAADQNDAGSADGAGPAEIPSLPTTPPGTELIPGLPMTDDLGEFIILLRDARDVAGEKSKKLSDRLAKVLESDPDERPERADDLVEDLRDWVDDGELDPTVADRALVFLALLGADVDDG